MQCAAGKNVLFPSTHMKHEHQDDDDYTCFLIRGPYGQGGSPIKLQEVLASFQKMEEIARLRDDDTMFLERPNEYAFASVFQWIQDKSKDRHFLLKSRVDRMISRNQRAYPVQQRVNMPTGYNLLVHEMQMYYDKITKDDAIPELVGVSLFGSHNISANRTPLFLPFSVFV